ncbi:MAG: DNA mismatch repair endonuclease MutL [Legionellaceae bacterium]|nr:DNA mismatch repair endonuclease MutL [Legionellaceae bacterium]
MRIHTLSAHVANQIAAGEVIERPASVVKELLENALDAGARTIHVEIGFGGLNQIKISDDGQGIVAEDLPLAIAAHATSKLQSLDDLNAIESMGFRGEALASIASVARVSIQSCAANQTEAMGLESDETGIRLVPCARSQGTTIDVCDLFFNAPVRKKFLKTERQEYQAIETLVKRIAFCETKLAITLSHNGQLRLNLPAAGSEQARRMRLTKLLGKAFVDDALSIDVTRGAMRLHGWTSGAVYGRSQQDKLWFYINHRFVRDKLVLHAVKQAYESVLPPGRYPGCVLFLTLPADEVDVNVHPTKHEVRFCDGRNVHDFIRSTLTEVVASVSVVEAEAGAMPSPAASTARQAWEQPSYAERYLSPSQASWLVLNTEFALVQHEGSPHVLHVTRLHQLRLLELLNHAACPWDARPLLVPVVMDFSSEQFNKLKLYQDHLDQYGVRFECLDEKNIRIRTIPCVLPGLDLHALFSALSELAEQGTQDKIDFASTLVHAEQLCISSMSLDEQAELLDYWKKHKKMSFCLDTEDCKKVLSHA